MLSKTENQRIPLQFEAESYQNHAIDVHNRYRHLSMTKYSNVDDNVGFKKRNLETPTTADKFIICLELTVGVDFFLN